MKIAVVFLTYSKDPYGPRHKYAMQSLTSLAMQLTFRDGELGYFIADDGSPPGHVEELHDLLKKYPVNDMGDSKTSHAGYGANYNKATQAVHQWADLVLPIEDDWELIRHFDLSDISKVFNERIQCVRLGYLGWTNPLIGEVVQSANQSFLVFNQYSTETHVFAGHPRLETVEFEKRLGPWPEGLSAGWTEMEVCNRPESKVGVAWPLDAGINASQDYCSLFAHIGELRA